MLLMPKISNTFRMFKEKYALSLSCEFILVTDTLNILQKTELRTKFKNMFIRKLSLNQLFLTSTFIFERGNDIDKSTRNVIAL